MSREFTKVGVVGLGTMGAGIAEVFARNGLPVVAIERDEAAILRGRGHVEHSTARAVARGKLTPAQQRALLERIDCGTDLAALAEADLVVEAVPEHLDLKRAIFAALDEICKPETILATNTSSLSVTEIAVATRRPGKVIGLHFFNPGAGDEARRDRAQRRHRAGRRRRCRGVRAEARQGRRDHRRPGRVHRERAALRLSQPRRGHVRIALRHPRGHRRRDDSSGAACPWARSR